MTTPSDRPQRPRRQRREPVIPTAEVALDERGEALSSTLTQVYEDFEAEVGAAVDEVTLTVRPEDVTTVCRIARQHPDIDCGYLRCLSVVDYVDRLEVNYHLFSLDKRHKFVVKTSVSPDEPSVPSIVSVWRGADWFERDPRRTTCSAWSSRDIRDCRRCCCTTASRASRAARASRSMIMTSGRMVI